MVPDFIAPAEGQQNVEDELFTVVQLWQLPDGSLCRKIYWCVMWIGNLIFVLTVPDVRRGKMWRRLYPLAFIICIVWIGSLSYLVTWFITVIGNQSSINNLKSYQELQLT